MCQLSDFIFKIEWLDEIALLPVGKFIRDLPTCKNEVQMIEILSDPPSKPLANFIKLLCNIRGIKFSILIYA